MAEKKKKKKTGAWLVHFEPFIGCMQLFLFPKLFVTIFGLV
jgi:hypothetical protein